MNITKNVYKIKCDVHGCKNNAEYRIEFKKLLRNSDMNICKDCLKSLYIEMAKIIVPKSPQNMLTKSGFKLVKNKEQE
ncbi:MAG: hypothetical protein M0R51_03240 [Clostridia bacterium]|jgi:hypothetical protein|nr:hypothetical protein [Clostridia bacterium]